MTGTEGAAASDPSATPPPPEPGAALPPLEPGAAPPPPEPTTSPGITSPDTTSPDTTSPDTMAPDPAAPTVVAPAVGAPAAGAPAAEPAAPGSPIALTKPLTARAGAHRAPAQDSRWGAYRDRRHLKRAEKAKKPHRKAPWWELPALVVLAVLIAILVKTFIVQPFYIPSQSMEHTLHGCPGCSGDRILVNKLIFDFRDPHPGDIVVFHAPTGWDENTGTHPPSNPVLRVIRGFGQLVGVVPPDGQVLVKRVIATGGQTVKGDAAGHVMVSKSGPGGPFRTLREPYVFIDPGQQNSLRTFGPVTVPNGRLWVMGDHRNDSADSRYHCGAGGTDASSDENCDPKASTVPIDDVIGKAFVIAWPPSRWRTLGTPSTFDSSASASAAGLPGMVATSVVLPIFVVRRRRRRR